jgi:NitT/TauT family transport system ATP-binding protein
MIIAPTALRSASASEDTPSPARGAITLRDLSVSFESPRRTVVALEEVNLDLAPGEFVALLGPSGCGKSTLLNVVAGFQEATEGEALLDGQPVQEPDHDRSVVFQQHSLFPWMSAIENVAFGPRMLGHRDPLTVARDYLELVGLGHCAQQYPSQLSGGMRQRVGLARALAVEPPVLLMDEPFGALDAQTRSIMQEQLLQIWEQSRNTVLFVTHDIDEAIFLADRIVVMGVQPSTIRQVVEVNLPRPRDLHLRHSDDYRRLHEQLFELIRTESLKSFRHQGC